jgi:hypothetical protein
MRKYVLMLACVFLGLCGQASAGAVQPSAQPADIGERVKKLVEEINLATIEGHYLRVLELTHPKAIELMGGPDKATQGMMTGLYNLGKAGLAIRSVAVQLPSQMVASNQGIFVVVPFTMELASTAQDQLLNESYVIGVSTDAGESWVFVSGSTSADDLKKILPNMPTKLVLPEHKAPVVRDLTTQVKELADKINANPSPIDPSVTPAAEKLIELGFGVLDHGGLELLTSNNGDTRRRGQYVLQQLVLRYFGYTPGPGWKGNIDRTAEVERAWNANGDYRWDSTLDQRKASHALWKKWVEEIRAAEPKDKQG